jgi:hypothetical protein
MGRRLLPTGHHRVPVLSRAGVAVVGMPAMELYRVRVEVVEP